MAQRSFEAPAMGPEAEALLCVARITLEAQDRERIARLLPAGLDWEAFLALAHAHGLLPLAHRHLNDLAPGLVPKTVLVELWGRYEAIARRNRGMARDLVEILAALEASGIAAIPYKGPALAFSLYGDVAMREYGDLDILVRAEDLLRARTILRDLRYHPEFPLEPAVEAAFLRSRSQYHLVLARERGTVVELHWKTDPEFPVEPVGDDPWWKSLPTARMEGVEVRRFAPREQLLILCLHGSKHFWGSLGWLVDIAELIKQDPRTDWEWIIARAASLRCERRLALALHLAHRLLRAPLPEEVIRRVDAGPVAALASAIRATLFAQEAPEPTALRLLELNLSLYECAPQRLAHLRDTLCAPSLVEWTRWPLPRALFFLYAPLRLARLTGKYVAKAAKGA